MAATVFRKNDSTDGTLHCKEIYLFKETLSTAADGWPRSTAARAGACQRGRAYCSCNCRHCTLPAPDFGNDSTMSTLCGAL